MRTDTNGWSKAAAGTALAVLLVVLFAGVGRSEPQSAAAASTAGSADGRHDFDAHIGTFKTHVRRRVGILTNSSRWAEYDGVSTVHSLWQGRANIVELDAAGDQGHLEFLSLRLYNPSTGQWSLNAVNSSVGVLDTPTVGRFTNGRGEFYDHQDFNGRPIIVRFVITSPTRDAFHFEQAFSADGGQTWEVNWIADDVRMSPGRN